MPSVSILTAIVVLPAGFFLLAWGLFSLRITAPAMEPAAAAGRAWAESSPAEPSGEDLDDREWVADPDEIKLRRSLTRRMVLPMLQAVAHVVERYTPAGLMEALAKRITAAGGFWGLSAGGVVALQVVLMVLGGVAGGALAGIIGIGGTEGVMVTGVLGLAGFIYPRAALTNRLRARQREISEALPNALDLLTIGIEAGLTFDAAIDQVTKRYQNELTAEFRIMLSELALGRSRDQALASVADRTDVEDVRIFVQAIIQSSETGGSLGQILRVQAVEARRRRRQRAQELGAKAPIKMLLPMVGCIFPAIFVVLLGPSVIIVGRAFLGQ